MEPLTTSAMIRGIVSFLGNKLVQDKSINSFFSEFTEATVNWIKPILLKEDGTEKEVIKNLKDKPDSAARKKAVESAFEVAVEDNENAEKYIKEMFEKILNTEESGKIMTTITNSINVASGNITVGGNVNIGDSGITQHISGSGDNVGRDKTILNTISGNDNITIQGVQDSEINLY